MSEPVSTSTCVVIQPRPAVSIWVPMAMGFGGVVTLLAAAWLASRGLR